MATITDPTTPPGLLDTGLQKTTPAPGTDQVTGYTPPGVTPAKAAATNYAPEGFAVTPDQTVAGQITKLIDQDSPLMQQAALRARTEANSRGLINSSMAVGAGQQAVISQALPIAQQDAATYNQAMTNTQNAKNAALNFGATATNTASNVNAQLANSVNLANQAAYTQSLSDAAKAANQRSLTVIDDNTKTQLAQLDANNRQLLQTNSNLSNMFSNVVTAIGNIQNSPNLDQTAKANAVTSQINFLNESLKTAAAVASTAPTAQAVQSLNLSQYFANPGFLTTP